MQTTSTGLERLKAAALALAAAIALALTLAPTLARAAVTYTALEEGTAQTLTVGSSKYYYYTFTPSEDGWYRYTLTSADSSLEDGAVVMYAVEGGNLDDSYTAVLIDLEDGVATATVPAYSSNVGGVKIYVDLDEVSSGATFALTVESVESTALSTSSSTSVSLSNSDRESAYFSFVPTSSTTYAFVAEATNGAYDYGVTVYDEDGDLDSDACYSGSYSAAQVEVTAGKTYFVEVFTRDDGDTTTSKLDVSIVKPVSISSATVTLDSSSYTFTGFYIYPETTVKLSGTVLEEGVSYSVGYKDNKAIGTATITITGTGKYKGSVTKTFKIKKPSSTTTLKAATTYEPTLSAGGVKWYTFTPSVGGTYKVASTATQRDSNNLAEYYIVIYDSSYSTLVTDFEAGSTTSVKLTKGTTYRIGVSYPYSWGYLTSDKVDFTLKVSRSSKVSISSATVTLSATSYTYTGSARKPTVKKLKVGSTTYSSLTAGTDYTISYSSNTKVGTATATITGKGEFKGTVTATFKIKKAKISSSKFTVTLSTSSYTYDGKTHKPTVTITNSSGKTISSSNYTVSYASGRKAVGKYKVTITAKGSNLSGSTTVYFKIVPKKVTVKSVKSSSTGKVTVKWSALSSANVTKYQIRYRVKGTSTWTTKTVSSSKTSATLTGLTSGSTYQVQVRAYKTVSSKNYTGSWSTAKTVTVK